MTVIAYIAAIAVTLVALAYLASTDPKRRRVANLPTYEGKRRAVFALLSALLPGIALIVMGDGAGLVVWLGATTILGWGVAALPPERSLRTDRWLYRSIGRLAQAIPTSISAARSAFAGLGAVCAAPRRIAELQERLRVLEEILAAVPVEQDRITTSGRRHAGDGKKLPYSQAKLSEMEPHH